jgi:hypothetical protein
MTNGLARKQRFTKRWLGVGKTTRNVRVCNACLLQTCTVFGGCHAMVEAQHGLKLLLLCEYCFEHPMLFNAHVSASLTGKLAVPRGQACHGPVRWTRVQAWHLVADGTAVCSCHASLLLSPMPDQMSQIRLSCIVDT